MTGICGSLWTDSASRLLNEGWYNCSHVRVCVQIIPIRPTTVSIVPVQCPRLRPGVGTIHVFDHEGGGADPMDILLHDLIASGRVTYDRSGSMHCTSFTCVHDECKGEG